MRNDIPKVFQLGELMEALVLFKLNIHGADG